MFAYGWHPFGIARYRFSQISFLDENIPLLSRLNALPIYLNSGKPIFVMLIDNHFEFLLYRKVVEETAGSFVEIRPFFP